MSLFVVYLTSQETPKILRATKVVAQKEHLEFIFEDGKNLVLPKSDVICWDEYGEGETAAILSREAVVARKSAEMLAEARHEDGTRLAE